MQEKEQLQSKKKWSCALCSFDNCALLSQCQMCGTKKPALSEMEEIKKSVVPPDFSEAILCPKDSCKHPNLLTATKCAKCLSKILSDDEEDKPEPIKKLVKCFYCNFQNDSSNETCVSCERLVNGRDKRKSVKKPSKPPKHRGLFGKSFYCHKCNSHSTYDYEQGTYLCQCVKVDLNYKRTVCCFCDSKMEPELAEFHDAQCLKRKEFFQVQGSKTFERMSKLQIDTIIYMHKKCQKLHYSYQNALRDRVIKLGYNPSELENLHHYIVNYAPIIIHMHVNRHMEFFIKDTHYRNQFETSKSSGSLSHSSRVSWENRMFDSKHNKASGFQRVKYGTMNFTNDPKGVQACSSYGQSYFLLKEHVRKRCTMTDMDSSSPSATICTFQFCYHLLYKLSDAELKAAFQGSKAIQVASNVIGMYKQIQIHGPVEFSKDIERVYISKHELDSGSQFYDMVKQFCKNNNLEYEIFQYKNHSGGLFGMRGVQPEKVGPRLIEAPEYKKKQEEPPKPVLPGGRGGLFAPAAYPFPQEEEYEKDEYYDDGYIAPAYHDPYLGGSIVFGRKKEGDQYI